MIHPAGDRHWTRQHGVVRQPWAKLSDAQIDELCAYYTQGAFQTWLARKYHIGRTTVWRYLKARNLIGIQGNN
jgi:DNA invertase Pin-like site-specific DNA recombinase